MIDKPRAYGDLEKIFARLGRLGEALAVLHWDTAAMMPDGGHNARSEQIAELRLVAHEILTSPATGDLLAEAATQTDALDMWQRANLEAMRRDYVHAAAVPADLVTAISKASSACEMRWRTARQANDFRGLKPHLEEVVALTRQVAEAKAAALGLAPYDALMDEYEPGGRAVEIARVFDRLKTVLPAMIDVIIERQAAEPAPLVPAGPFPADRQRALAQGIMAAVGFNFAHGRLDTSHHPFCGGVPDDVRITTRWDERDFTRGLMGVLHETGHALYERGLPAAWRHQPVGRARGMALHESQSLLVEMQAARSPAFLGFLGPAAADVFDGTGPAYDPANLARLYTRVRRSLIRVDADEATYPTHVILRFEIERALIAGDLAVADLPAAWAEGMAKIVGIVPPDDRDGCLQDIHWPSGAFGYFPTYTLGALAAAQLFAAALAAESSIPEALGRGDFRPLLAWLRPNVHEKGSLMSTDEVLIAATGRPLGTEAFEAHLKRRYLDA